MPTERSQSELDLGRSNGRKLVGAFDGGAITSNGGVVLLAAADRAIGLGCRLAGCFSDLRIACAVRHSVADLLRQRIFGIALGHEDLIDHDALRDDPALAAVLDKPGGRLAGKSTLNRMEHAGKIGQDRHHKLDHDPAAIERLLVDIFLDAHDRPPPRIVIDLDATDDPVYGDQEGPALSRLLRLLLLPASVRLLRSASARGQAPPLKRRRCRRQRLGGHAHRRTDPGTLA
jgi:hypothetical protein